MSDGEQILKVKVESHKLVSFSDSILDTVLDYHKYEFFSRHFDFLGQLIMIVLSPFVHNYHNM